MNKYTYVRGKGQSYDHPSHARRFPRYASRAALKYNDYLSDKIVGDICVLSLSADITLWRRKKANGNCKIIFDANDPFLLADYSSIKDYLRGSFKFFSRRHQFLEFDYKKSYLRICEAADSVVVGHHAQYQLLKDISDNVSLISDYGLVSPTVQKTEFGLSDKKTVNIFWEGLGSSFMPFRLIEEIFQTINSEYDFIFHFVTDLSFFRYGDIFYKVNIQDIAKRAAPSMYKQFRFYQWSEYMMNKIAVACDFGIIPLPDDGSMNYWKPENKLIQMWRMSLPTITSSIPSYVMAFKDAKHKLYASDLSEWRDFILGLSESRTTRKKFGLLGKYQADKFYSDEIIDDLWKKNLGML